MKRGFQYLIWMFLFSSPLCAKDFLLPHVADGWFAGGIIRMTVIYLNPATDVVTAELILTRDDGAASAWFFPREDRSSSKPLPWAP